MISDNENVKRSFLTWKDKTNNANLNILLILFYIVFYIVFNIVFIENRKFQKIQLHSPSGSNFMAILRIFPAEFDDKMLFGAFLGYP